MYKFLVITVSLFVVGCATPTSVPVATPTSVPVATPTSVPVATSAHTRSTSTAPASTNKGSSSGKPVSLVSGQYAKEANDNPFLNGELNPLYVGEVTALKGQVIEIQQTKQQFPVYKLNLGLEGIKPIWVTSIGPAPTGGISRGNIVIFYGYISSSLEMDPTGELMDIIQSETLLLAVKTKYIK